MTEQKLPTFFSGLSGIELPIPKYQFPSEYQKTSRLTYYSSFFNTIEINSSFYKIPMDRTVQRWASCVDKNFKFTFKLFREITHAKNLNFDVSHIERFIHTINNVGEKKSCLLVQFPPSLQARNIQQLENLLKSIKLNDPNNSWNVAVEFRNKGWYNQDVYDLIEYYKCVIVIHDIPASATPLTSIPADFIYLRFHGPTGNYRGSYTDAFLVEYAEYIKEWISDGKMVFAYFNNTAGDAFNNLSSLNKVVLG
jgi:uncharacterized protein YecE (DUF72 family)